MRATNVKLANIKIIFDLQTRLLCLASLVENEADGKTNKESLPAALNMN